MPWSTRNERRRKKWNKSENQFLIEFRGFLVFSSRRVTFIQPEADSSLITQYFCTQHRLNLHIICLHTHRAPTSSALPPTHGQSAWCAKSIMKCDDDTKWKPIVGSAPEEEEKLQTAITRKTYGAKRIIGWRRLTLLSAEAFSFQYRGKICYSFSCCYILGTARCVGLDDETTSYHRFGGTENVARASLTLIRARGGSFNPCCLFFAPPTWLIILSLTLPLSIFHHKFSITACTLRIIFFHWFFLLSSNFSFPHDNKTEKSTNTENSVCETDQDTRIESTRWRQWSWNIWLARAFAPFTFLAMGFARFLKRVEERMGKVRSFSSGKFRD